MQTDRRSSRLFRPHLVAARLALVASVGCVGNQTWLADDEHFDATASEDGGAVDGDSIEDSGIEVDPEGHDEAGHPEAEIDAPDGADSPPDADGADSPPDADGADSPPDADAPDEVSNPCPDGWHDPSTGRCWEGTSAEGRSDWNEAVRYCESLARDGLPAGSWRLPTISELRSLIRGCPPTMTGGACRVTDSCLSGSCTSSSCAACDYLGGPAADGCYWEPGVAGLCTWYWSASTYAGSASYAWVVDFYDASVYSIAKTNSRGVRCIRHDP
jgi:hypothetical protein